MAIDIDQLPAHLNPATDITAADFFFEIWDPAEDEWIAAPAPSSVIVHLNEGEDGADRIEVHWADDSIVARWLRVGVLDSLLGSEGPGVADYYDFIFGSLPGDTNSDGVVDGEDLTNFGIGYFAPGGATDRGFAEGDFNLDGFTDDLDLTILGFYYNQYLEQPGE